MTGGENVVHVRKLLVIGIVLASFVGCSKPSQPAPVASSEAPKTTGLESRKNKKRKEKKTKK